MRKIHKLLLPAIIFMMAIIQVKAQGTAGIDVIPNGGFEKWQDTGQPTGWRIVAFTTSCEINVLVAPVSHNTFSTWQ